MNEASIGKVLLDLEINQQDMQRQLNAIARQTEGMVGNAFSSLGATIAAAFATISLFEFGRSSLQLASDLQEIQNVVDVTFGNMSADINAWSKTTLESFGLSELSAKKYSSTMGAMLKSSGLAGQQMKEMSMNMTELAVDMSSFYNLKHEDAFYKIQAGISGEIEPLRRLGVNMTVVNLEAYAMAQGITKSYEAMTQAEQIQLRYNYLMKATADAQGDFARTSNSWANQVRLMSEQWNIFKTTMGQGFINVLAPIVKGLNHLIVKLQVAAQYFKAFTELIFGKTQQASGAIAPVAEMGDAIGGVGSGLGGVGKEAKKAGKDIKGSLGSFDQLNTISQGAADSLGDATGGLGGLGAGAGAIDFGEVAKGEIEIDTSVLDKLKGSLDFKPLIESFNGLKESIAPFKETMFAGLKWGLDNILVPLSHWTVGQALPAFLDLLAGAFGFLNPLLLSFKPSALWLFDNFLKPIASWTGGVIVGVLKGLGDILSKIGKWMSDNQPIVDAMTSTVVAFFAAWGAIELMAFIQLSGGLISALKSITAAVKAGTVAKVADRLVTMQLKAMYAVDFVKALAKSAAAVITSTAKWIANTAALVANKIALGVSALAQGVMTAAMIAWNVAATVGTAITWAFNAALAILTSPITMVIAAIALLVAGIVLLYKNWDTVKAKGAEVWNSLVNTWKVAGTWFTNNVSNPVKNTLNGAWISVQNAWGSAKSWFETKVTNPIRNLFGNMGTYIQNTFKAAINKVIDGLNVFIRGMNRLDFSAPSWVPVIGGKSFGINIPTIPRLASGGLVSAPTLAMVGDNRNASAGDPEVIAPLSKLQAMLEDILNNNPRNGGGGGDTTVILKIGETELGRATIKAINSVQRQAGVTLITV